MTLKCTLVDDVRYNKDVTTYSWYLNSECLTRRENFFIDFSLRQLHRDLFHFMFPFSSLFFAFLFFLCSPLSTRTPQHTDAPADKKIISNEHFVKRDNELVITNAVKHLSGFYSCVVEFMNSGAKLETPQELINIVGE